MKDRHALGEVEAEAILREAEEHTLSVSGEGGEAPLLRVLHGAWYDGGLYFHSSPKSALSGAVGKRAAVFASDRAAIIPSYLRDPLRACPATTYYDSAMAYGVLECVASLEERASALSALMERLQPEGGYWPITASRPEYRPALKGLCIVRLRIDRLVGKRKMGQMRTPGQLERVLAGLWCRGGSNDMRAIERIRAACDHEPSFARSAVRGVTQRVWLSSSQRDEAVGLLTGAYWLEGRWMAGHRLALDASECVGAEDEEGALIGFARGVSDRLRRGWIYDVIVREDWRGRGVGEGLVRLLLDHPALRGVDCVSLGTRDAQPFYRRLGFEEGALRRPWPTSTMHRRGG